MIFVQHRKNSASELLSTERDYGVEVDIRSDGSQLIVQHDPFVPGEPFDEWIRAFEHALLILNVKEDGLEPAILSRLGENKVENFFFLDQAFPSLVRLALSGENRCAVRVSDFESVETALKLSPHVKWVWVDSFRQFPLSKESSLRLRSSGVKVCVVSPELQGKYGADEIANLANHLRQLDLYPDAICTKFVDRWEETGVVDAETS